MAISLVLASFPNSRIKPRNAASQAATTQVNCPNGVATLVAAQNANRVYLSLRNTDNAKNLYYGYSPLVDATTGFLLRSYESFEVFYLGDVYIFNPNATPIVVDIDEGSG